MTGVLHDQLQNRPTLRVDIRQHLAHIERLFRLLK